MGSIKGMNLKKFKIYINKKKTLRIQSIFFSMRYCIAKRSLEHLVLVSL